MSPRDACCQGDVNCAGCLPNSRRSRFYPRLQRGNQSIVDRVGIAHILTLHEHLSSDVFAMIEITGKNVREGPGRLDPDAARLGHR